MALVITSRPKLYNLSGNPVEFIVSSNTVVNSNHKIHIQVSTQSFSSPNIIGEESLSVITPYSPRTFDMSDYVKVSTPFNLTIHDLFDKALQLFGSAIGFYFRIYETYNNDGIEHNAILPGPDSDNGQGFYAVNGGFSKLFLQNYINEGKNFYTNFIQTDKKFLTWAPSKKLTWNQHELLWFVVQAAENAYYKITITYNDNSTNELDSEEISISPLNLCFFNASYLANELDAYDTEEKYIISYTAQVYNDSDVAITEAKTYYVDRNTYNFGRQFVFLNSLGGYDIIHLKGVSEAENKIKRTEGYFQTKDAVISSEYTENFKAASGFVINHFTNVATAQRYISEFFNSKEIYEIVNKNFIPVIPKSEKLNIKTDGQFLYTFNFEYYYAQTDEYYSELSQDQYLNPRIFYRDGIIEDVAPGQTATVNFDVTINQDTTVNFTLDWGIDVGLSYLNGIVLEKDIPCSLEDEIIIPGTVNGERTLTVTDNLGGKYYIDYMVSDDQMLFNDGEEMIYNDNEEMFYN